MSQKRVVVTGLSAITPLGNNLKESWSKLLAGESGIAPITLFDASEYACKIAAEVKQFNPENYGILPKQSKRMDRFVQFAVASASELIKDSEFQITEANAYKIGVILGVGLGGLKTIEVFHEKLQDVGPNRISPFMIPMLISNMAPGQVAISTGAKGPNFVVTSACASGTHAIGLAYSEILLGRCIACITGGVESTITKLCISGFSALKALSTNYNDMPTQASRPFDKNRDGFVAGEGTGYLMLEELEHAKARGAKIYAELIGFGTSDDASHMTAPGEDAEGMSFAMKQALKSAQIAPEKITHINAHGTSTFLNDMYETAAIKKTFGSHAYNIAICSNKSQIGHLLGAAGGIEAVFSVMSLYTGIVPGTINYTTPDPNCDLNYMPNGPQELKPQYVLSNSFGFGGTNASLIFKKFES